MKITTRVSNILFGLLMRTLFQPGYSPQFMRRAFDFIAGISVENLKIKYSNLEIQQHKYQELTLEHIATMKGKKKTILYMHGGGYFMGSIRAYRRNAMRLAYHCDSEVVLFDYRLSPEHPYPAALEDAVKAYHYLLKKNEPENLIFAGDSAGGGLVLATLLFLRDNAIQLPSRAFCICPWADLTGLSSTIDTHKDKDVWLQRIHYQTWAPWYSPGHDFHNPYISPAFGNFGGLPKLLVLVGDQETLIGDSLSIQNLALNAGVDCTLYEGKGMQHNWMFALPHLQESKKAMSIISKFVLE